MNALEFPCEICREAEAEVVDEEHGAICFNCHDNLEEADQICSRIAFTVSPQPTTNPHHE